MGYYTDRNLTIDGHEDDIERFKNFAEKTSKENDDRGDLYSQVLSILDDWYHSKWYQDKEDFIEISKAWPTLKFSIHCKGEEGEEYIQHFWGGNYKCQNSRLEWDDFSFNEIAPLIGKLDEVLRDES